MLALECVVLSSWFQVTLKASLFHGNKNLKGLSLLHVAGTHHDRGHHMHTVLNKMIIEIYNKKVLIRQNKNKKMMGEKYMLLFV